ncbi:MAG: hypothetical protein U0P45_03015 [Acidimicrobiales bacterium]
MQPTSRDRHASHRTTLAGLTVAAMVLLAARGGSSSDGASKDTSPTKDAATTTAATGDGSVSDDTTTTAGEGDDLDLCAELTQSDVEELLGGASLSGAKPQEALTAPNCDYVRTMDAGGSTMDGFVVRIVRSDASYFDSQKELQTDALEVPGLDAFAYNDFGTIVVRGKSGTFEVVRGIELADGGEVANQAQMTAIAQQVQDL